MEQARAAGRGEYERDEMTVLPARMLVEVKAEAYHLGELLPCVLPRSLHASLDVYRVFRYSDKNLKRPKGQSQLPQPLAIRNSRAIRAQMQLCL